MKRNLAIYQLYREIRPVSFLLKVEKIFPQNTVTIPLFFQVLFMAEFSQLTIHTILMVNYGILSLTPSTISENAPPVSI